MADTIETLNVLALQIRVATKESENTAERIGRILVGIITLMENSEISLEVTNEDDTLEVLKELAGQIRNASIDGENTAEKIGRVFVGILNLLERSGVQFEIAEGSDSIEVLKTLSLQVRHATNEGENTAEKVGRIFVGILNLLVPEGTPIDFLVRSDKPDVYYSSTQSVFDSLKTDYPDGLTRDVTITCVKPAREKRTSGVWVAYLEEWNSRTMYTLTVDGRNLLLYDGKSLGCLMFRQVDNVIIRNTGFVNFSNGVEATTPDACFAIYCWGTNHFRCANLYVGNCEFDGSSINPDKMSASTLSCMNVDNVTLAGCSFRKNYGYTFTITDCGMVSMVRNTISVDHSLGVVSHPSVLEMQNSRRLIFEDNDISGDIRESYVNLNNVDYIYFRRNKLHDGGGEALNVSSLLGTKALVIESNLFRGLLMNPVGGWMKHYISPGLVSSLRVCNNTFYMSGEFYEQYAIRYGVIGELHLYNNIVVKAADQLIHAFSFESIGELHSGSNIYQFEYDPGRGDISGIIITTTAQDSPVSIPLNISHYLSKIQGQGYEQNSAVVERDAVLLSSGYAITGQYDSLYKADDARVPFADLAYNRAASSRNSRGCYNLAGTVIDENRESRGYTGCNLETDASFSAESQYAAMAESILMLTHNTPNRGRLIKWSVVGSVHRYLLLGKYCMLAASPVLDADGEYVEDELYTIKVVQDD